VAAAQNAAGSHLTMASPARVSLAAAVVGHAETEAGAAVMRQVLLINLGALALLAAGLLLWAAGTSTY